MSASMCPRLRKKWPVGAVGHQIDPELTLGRLNEQCLGSDRGVDFAPDHRGDQLVREAIREHAARFDLKKSNVTSLR